MVEAEEGGDFGMQEGLGDGDESVRRKALVGFGVLGQEATDFVLHVIDNTVTISVKNNDIVGSRAGDRVKGNEGTVGEVTATPEVHSRCVTVLADKSGVSNADIREGIIVGGVVNEGRADGEEGVNESPGVLKAGAYTKKGVSAD